MEYNIQITTMEAGVNDSNAKVQHKSGGLIFSCLSKFSEADRYLAYTNFDLFFLIGVVPK